MSKFIKILLLTLPLLFLIPFFFPTLAADFGPGPAGIPQLQYLVARLVCISVPMGFTAMFVVLVIAGFKFLVSAGEAKAIASANLTVTWAFLGVLFMAIAWLVLLLIQNATGAKVTEFNLATLPGVQGFTGSCWAPPPVAQQSYNQTAIVNLTSPGSTIIPQTSTPISLPNFDNFVNCSNYPGHEILSICLVTNICDNEGEDFEVTGSVTDTSNAGFNLFYTAVTLNNLRGLGNVLPEPEWINIFAGTDTNIYNYTAEFTRKLNSLLPSVYISDEVGTIYSIDSPEARHQANLAVVPYLFLPGLNKFGKFPKGNLPPDYVELALAARQIVTQLNPNQGDPGIIGISCPNADYYSLTVLSPLIYLYPLDKTTISVKIDSPRISTILKPNQNGSWNVLASPDGTLTTLDGKKHKFIPYEFLRNDFKRPERGVIIEGKQLEEYLKNDLWKKLGLKDSEIEDYWWDTKPRVPNSPYYFISLIDRSEIDRVLPMEINPKPDTIIRNMTYILPLLTKPSYAPQPLEITTPKRNGFTVLENGVFTDGF